MDDYKFAHTLLEQCPGGMAKANGIEAAFGLADLESSGFARFNFIQDAVIDMLEGWVDDSTKAVAILADHIDTGLNAGGLRRSQQAGGFGAEFRIRLIQCVEQEKVSQVENPGTDPSKVQ